MDEDIGSSYGEEELKNLVISTGQSLFFPQEEKTGIGQLKYKNGVQGRNIRKPINYVNCVNYLLKGLDLLLSHGDHLLLHSPRLSSETDSLLFHRI